MMAKKSGSFLNKETVCSVCHGKKYLECCSVDGTDCERIICPNCQGKGTVYCGKNVALLAGISLLALIAVVAFIVYNIWGA